MPWQRDWDGQQDTCDGRYRFSGGRQDHIDSPPSGARSSGKRIALIINEFGELGIDGEILRGCGVSGCDDESIVELSNGCICCTVADEFVPTMKSLISMERPPDHIVIETSGLALPQPLVRAFNWPDLRNRLTVDGVVALLDGPAIEAGQFAHDIDAVDRQRREDDGLDHDTPLAELFEDQLACADLVVINKADLLTDDGLERVKSSVTRQLRPGVSAIATKMGAVDPLAVLGIDAAAETDPESRVELHHHHGPEDPDGEEADHDHDEFDTIAIELPEITEPGRIPFRSGRCGAPPRASQGQGIRRGCRQADEARRPGRRTAGEFALRQAHRGQRGPADQIGCDRGSRCRLA